VAKVKRMSKRGDSSSNTKKSLWLVSAIAVLVVVWVWVINDLPTDDRVTDGSEEPKLSSSIERPVIASDLNSPYYKKYEALKGDDRNRQYLAEMIEHHAGAVTMAELALERSTRADIKQFAQNIIDAQTVEINTMRQLQLDAGYPSSSGPAMEDHSAMGMADHMALMNLDLSKKSGTEFDKEFLIQMKGHHQIAFDMSNGAITDNDNQGVVRLIKNILSVQGEEIKQINGWLDQLDGKS
jgi:uncharacterized protein (DUF305 family)